MSAPTKKQWIEIRKDAESAAVSSWWDLAKKHGVSRDEIKAKRAEDAAAGKPWMQKWAPKAARMPAPAQTPALAPVDAPAPARDTSNVLQFPTPVPSDAQGSSAGRGAGRSHRRYPSSGVGSNRRGGDDAFIQAVPLVDTDDAIDPVVGVEDQDDDPLSNSSARVSRLALAAAEGFLRLVLRGQIQPGMHQSLGDVVDKAVATAERATKLARLNAGKSVGDPSGDGTIEIDNELRIVSERVEVAKRPAPTQKATA